MGSQVPRYCIGPLLGWLIEQVPPNGFMKVGSVFLFSRRFAGYHDHMCAVDVMVYVAVGD